MKQKNSQYFFSKFSWMGPWVSRIDCCEGHQCGSTYMAMRLSDITSKTVKKHKKCIFSLFQSLCRTATSMPFASPLEFISIQPQNGGPLLKFININLEMGVCLQGQFLSQILFNKMSPRDLNLITLPGVKTFDKMRSLEYLLMTHRN